MSEIVIYGVVGSPFVRSVEMGLKEKRAPYRLHAMNPEETKSEAYLKCCVTSTPSFPSLR